jgi:Protein of unknown function (DUF4239)
MRDWLLTLPIPWMALIIFGATYLIAACVYLAVVRLAVGDRARAFKAFSPGMLPPLGIIFGLLVGFVAVQVWNDFDKAKLAVATEASALRAVVLLDGSLPEEQRMHLRTLINRHIDEAANREWPAMAHEHLTLATLPTALVEALQLTVSLNPQDEAQRTAQREIVAALQRALDARRQRIIISQSSVGPVKWAAILLQGLCALIAIALVHSDNRLTCAIAVAIFATGIALSSLLIAAYSRPFTGDISVKPELLRQVVPSETATSQSGAR